MTVPATGCAANAEADPLIGNRLVVFRVDAGSGVGLGHLRRCRILADEVRRNGCDTLFVCADRFGPEIEALVAPHRIRWLGADRTERHARSDTEAWDARATLSIIAGCGAPIAWVVLDSYRLGLCWERRVHGAGHRILAIDDYRHRRHHADLIVGEAEASFAPALNELGGTARVLAGRRYALVDAACRSPPGIADQPAAAAHLLVSYGGADHTGETLKALEALRILGVDAGGQGGIGRVVVVAGPANPRFREVAEAAEGIPGVILHRMVPSLAPLIVRSDLVLTSGGNSMIEALASGKPCLVTVTADNQTLAVDELARDGVIRSLGDHVGVDAVGLSAALAEVVTGLDSLSACIAARAPVDCLGARRLVAEMGLLDIGGSRL
jgi:spore coat polysaccharide biosynthesis predicted glycosyltransferase SpsG